MTDKFRNKYRIPSTRLQQWDYRWNASYFVTICTQNKAHYFGDVRNGNMSLSPVGVLADILWHETIYHAQSIELGAFVVMPNHIHGILTLGKGRVQDDKPKAICPGQARHGNVEANSLSSIIGSYKSAVSKHARRMGLEFAWQPRFHDHIIRNQRSYDNIAQYIRTNPAKWQADRFFNKNKIYLP
ncbi:hypothetical protein FUAX_43610 (plasmid) [Fulvitalea axinellae]|uniref:Transposase IS200-like domain-containing protein n=2 Tax=Fulvitalea axinellae TaxID=1182444 RepID=A0AAU9DBS4_9BACT|nr:hypothetical protein FUAX_43610 [Fulvitalea axinellae]